VGTRVVSGRQRTDLIGQIAIARSSVMTPVIAVTAQPNAYIRISKVCASLAVSASRPIRSCRRNSR